MKTDLVVAVYRERIDWLKSRNFSNEKIFAYKKFERFDYDFIETLPNEGRESHTFIYHIIKYLNNFESDYTIFLQGNPFRHLIQEKDSIASSIFENNYELHHLYYPLGNYCVCDSFGRPYSHWDCELYTFWNELFIGDIPNQFLALNGAQQIVHNSLINYRSKKFWEKAMELHYTSPTAPWAFEIMWPYIFDHRFKSI